MKNLSFKFSFFFVILLLIAVRGSTSQLSDKMLAMSHTLNQLLPLIAEEKMFLDPKNKSKIEESIDRLSKLVHQMDFSGQDAGVSIMGSQLKETLERSRKLLESNQLDGARSSLISVTETCIACHSRVTIPNFHSRASLVGEGKIKNPVAQAAYLAAVRRNDEALLIYDELISNANWRKDNPVEWVRVVQKALVLAIRTETDPTKALEMIGLAKTFPDIPDYLSEDLDSWKAGLEEWKKEKKRTLKSDKDLLAEARRLMKLGQTRKQEVYEMSDQVYYLRAAHFLHRLLREFPASKLKAEAMFFLGVSYEALLGIDDWALHEAYYESCIHAGPHSKQAQKCYARLERAVYNWRTEAGSQLSGSTALYLKRMKDLSK